MNNYFLFYVLSKLKFWWIYNLVKERNVLTIENLELSLYIYLMTKGSSHKSESNRPSSINTCAG